MYYKIKGEIVPQYFTIVIPTPTHNYFTRRAADQRHRTYHAFADHNCLHAMIDLLNKSPLTKVQVTASISLPHFVSFVKQQCFRHYECFCNVNNCYVCNGNWIYTCQSLVTLSLSILSPFHFPPPGGFSNIPVFIIIIVYYTCVYNIYVLCI